MSVTAVSFKTQVIPEKLMVLYQKKMASQQKAPPRLLLLPLERQKASEPTHPFILKTGELDFMISTTDFPGQLKASFLFVYLFVCWVFFFFNPKSTHLVFFNINE